MDEYETCLIMNSGHSITKRPSCIRLCLCYQTYSVVSTITKNVLSSTWEHNWLGLIKVWTMGGWGGGGGGGGQRCMCPLANRLWPYYIYCFYIALKCHPQQKVIPLFVFVLFLGLFPRPPHKKSWIHPC